MAWTRFRWLAVACLTFALAPTVWGFDPPPGGLPQGYPPSVLPAAGYPAGMPPSPLRDLTPVEMLSPTAPPMTGHAPSLDLVPHDDGHHAETGLFGNFEYLLMRPRREALQYALLSGTTAPTPIGRTESLNFDLNSGVRASAGYRFAPGWDGAFTYMYFRSTAEGSTSVPPGGILYPTLTRPGFVDSALAAAANASVLLNVYDVEVGRRFELAECFTGRVYGGFRFADVNQSFNAAYNGRDAAGSQVSTSNDFRGYGPIVGAEGAVSVCRGLQLYARASAGLLTGTSNFGLRETNQNGQSVYADYTSSARRVVPVGGVGIGMGWNAGRLSIQGGYEITYWGSIVETVRLSSDFSPGKTTTTSESLSLEGFFVRVGWAF